jgi:CRP-like cAMP-binding protein
MNVFLTKISQLASIQEVLLLSLSGELLFPNNKNETAETDGVVSQWNAIIAGLNSPVEAEFFFERGIYYLQYTDVGYVIVGMNGFGRLQQIKSTCSNLQAKLSDPDICRKVLLKMLSEIDEALMPQFIMTLLPFADDEIAETLIGLLGKEAELGQKVRMKVLVNICQVLGQCSSSAAQRSLKKLLQEHDAGQIALEKEVRHAAQVALVQLELDCLPESNTARLREDEFTRDKILKDDPLPSAPSLPGNQFTAEVPGGQKIQDLLNQSRSAEAVALIMAQIEICAFEKKFDLAEKLREWLIQIDPASLREIIRAAELIEDEKKASISDEYLDVWDKLARTLSTEDFSSLYHAMVHKSYNNGEIVVKQGEFLTTLFFVNSGRVQLFSAIEGGEHSLKVVEAGEILGVETFFDISIWTMSARSMGADLSLLTWDRLLRLKESNPALQRKLMDFCSQFKVPRAALNKLFATRRQFERVKVSGKVAIAPLKKMGKESLFEAKGGLLDISRGGLAFSLRFSRRKNAITLLGQNVRVTVRTDVSAVSVCRNGIVKAVQCHDFVGNDYSIHVEFGELLSDNEMRQAVGGSDSGNTFRNN